MPDVLDAFCYLSIKAVTCAALFSKLLGAACHKSEKL